MREAGPVVCAHDAKMLPSAHGIGVPASGLAADAGESAYRFRDDRPPILARPPQT